MSVGGSEEEEDDEEGKIRSKKWKRDTDRRIGDSTRNGRLTELSRRRGKTGRRTGMRMERKRGESHCQNG